MAKLSSSSWFGLMKRRNESNSKKKTSASSFSSSGEEKKKKKTTKSPAIGVLSFEISRLMSRTVLIWNSLTDPQICRLHDQALRLDGVRKLVSADDSFLLGTALAEIAESLGSLSRSVSVLGARCVDPVLRRFDRVFADLVESGSDPYGLRYAGRKMERKVKKMERLVAAGSNLRHELEVLAELEQTLRRMPPGSSFGHKVLWQRKEVKCLREASLWNRSYDYAVRLLARSLFTIVGRMNHVFGFNPNCDDKLLPRSYSFAEGTTHSSVHPSDSDGGRSLARFSSGPLLMTDTVSGDVGSLLPPSWKRRTSSRKNKWLGPSRSFSGCIAGDGKLPVTDSCMPVDIGSRRSNAMKHKEADVQLGGNIFKDTKLSRALFEPSRTLLHAPPCTLGAVALHLHYANVIILIEKFAASPHLIGPDARDDLYNMLPTSIRAALRARLKSYAKKLSSAVYDPVLAAEWSEAVTRILDWLCPLAYNMIKWQSERNFEQQLLVASTNVFLVQTLYFAHQAKTEAAITELLVGLNYLWRFGKELNEKATSECASSIGFDDSLNLNG